MKQENGPSTMLRKLAEGFAAEWCRFTHGGGHIERDPSGRVNWQCCKCGRWAEPVSESCEADLLRRWTTTGEHMNIETKEREVMRLADLYAHESSKDYDNRPATALAREALAKEVEAVLSGAEEARRQERRRCALICLHYAKRHDKGDDESKAQAWMMLQCAKAIEKDDPQPQSQAL